MIKYIGGLNTIKQAADLEILQYEKDKKHILAYFSESKHHPAGWFSVDLDYAAKDLMRNEKKYELIQNIIKEKMESQTLDEKIKSNTLSDYTQKTTIDAHEK